MDPTVSVIVPCYNEEETIGALLGAILAQTYPRQRIEVVIADGLSRDKTREVIQFFCQAHPELSVQVVENPLRTIPSSLNLAMRQSRGEIILRLDAHSMPTPEYVDLCVRDIGQGKGANVGGLWIICPGGSGWVARGIAAAAGHILGAGDASYRLGGQARPVDTVPFGAFRRTLLERTGFFDESLLTNEDYEFNARVRSGGGIVWFDPQIRSTYVARRTLGALARQYWRYGYWKCRMLLRHPGTMRWRQALPVLFVLSAVVLAGGSFFWHPALLLLALQAVLYAAALLAGGIDLGVRTGDALAIPGSMLAFATMHLAWGVAFWWSLLTSWFGSHG